MTRKRKLLSVLGVSLVVLAACDGSDGVFGNPASQFGENFEVAFGAGSNDAPRDNSADGTKDDLTITFAGDEGVSLTDQPLDI